MEPKSFCYWLQGLFELSPETNVLDSHQVEVIKRHLALVFEHIDTPDPTGKLQAIHDGKPAKAEITTIQAIHSKTPRIRC